MKKTKKSISEVKTKIKDFFNKVWQILLKPHMAILPGQLAFSIILSLVPIITLIMYGASYFNISIDSIIELLKNNFSEEVVNIVIPIISGKSLDLELVIILILMFYFASNGANSVILAANEIYGLKQSTWIKRRLKALAITFLIVILFLFILLVPVFGEKIIEAIDYFNLKGTISSILSVIRGPISWIVIFVFIKVIFTFAPNKSIPASRINIGAIFTTIGWVLVTYFYGYYINNFARYDLFYAGLSNIMILMLWIYFLSYILVVGLSLTTSIDDNILEKTGSIEVNK